MHGTDHDQPQWWIVRRDQHFAVQVQHHLRTIRDQSRGWSDGGIARAIRAVARADADIKGAASDASYTLERLVLTVAGLRDGR